MQRAFLSPLVTPSLALWLLAAVPAGADEPQSAPKVESPAAPNPAPESPKPIPPNLRYRGQFDVTNDSKTMKRVRQSLNSGADIEFPSASLREVCEFLESLLDVKIRLDEAALREIRCDLDDKFAIHETHSELRGALKNLFPETVEVIPHEGAILITSRKVAHATLETRLYDIALLTRAGLKPDDILTLVEKRIESTKHKTGTASIEGDLLIVRQNDAAHADVLKFIHGKVLALMKREGM